MKGELFYLARVIASIPGELTYQRVTNPKLTRVKEQQYATNFSGMKKGSQIWLQKSTHPYSSKPNQRFSYITVYYLVI